MYAFDITPVTPCFHSIFVTLGFEKQILFFISYSYSLFLYGDTTIMYRQCTNNIPVSCIAQKRVIRFIVITYSVMTFNNKFSQHPQLSCMLGTRLPTFMLMQSL